MENKTHELERTVVDEFFRVRGRFRQLVLAARLGKVGLVVALVEALAEPLDSYGCQTAESACRSGCVISKVLKTRHR